MSEPNVQPCPVCDAPLEVVSGRHGIVLACVDCQAGATTLAVLKKVAPRAFVNHVWQAAQKSGRPGRRRCPSCRKPLLELRGPAVRIEPRVDVCLRCYLVWLGADALSRAPVASPLPDGARALALARVRIQGLASPQSRGDGREVAEGIVRALLGAATEGRALPEPERSPAGRALYRGDTSGRRTPEEP